MRFLVFYGSYRSERLGIDVAEYMTEQLKKAGHEAKLIDAKEVCPGMLDKMYKEYDGDAPAWMSKLADRISEADGFVLVSGEYNHSMQPGLTNLMNYFQEEYLHKPTGIVAYSPSDFGGARAAMQVRAFMAELGSITIPSILYFPRAHTLKEKISENSSGLHERTTKFIKELIWYADALKRKRES